jgi:type IV secretion system protein VirB3
MDQDDDGLEPDPLFVGMTRPATVMGIPYVAFVILIMVTAIVFLFVGNPLYLMLGLPVYAILYMVSASNPFIFGSWWAWAITLGRSRNQGFWGSRSFSPLRVKKWGRD